MKAKLTEEQVYQTYKLRILEKKTPKETITATGIAPADIYSVVRSIPRYFNTKTSPKPGLGNTAYYNAAQRLLSDFPELHRVRAPYTKKKNEMVKEGIIGEPVLPLDHYARLSEAFLNLQKAVEEFAEAEFKSKSDEFIKRYSLMEVANTTLTEENTQLKEAVKSRGGLLESLRVRFGRRLTEAK